MLGCRVRGGGWLLGEGSSQAPKTAPRPDSYPVAPTNTGAPKAVLALKQLLGVSGTAPQVTELFYKGERVE